MPQSNRRLPKIERPGKPVARTYRALGSGLASPIPYQPQAAPAPRLTGGYFSNKVTELTTDFNPPLHHEHR